VLPSASVSVVNVAVPLESTVAVPEPFLPSANVTVPVGVPAPGADTVTFAVKVIGAPRAAGFALEETVVFVPAFVTTWERVAELARNPDEPAYAAVMTRVPAPIDAREQAPEPEESAAIVQLAPRSSLTVTAPAGVPLVALTVTVTA